LSLKQNLGESSYMWSNIVPISCGSVNGEVSLGSDFLLRILGMEKVWVLQTVGNILVAGWVC